MGVGFFRFFTINKGGPFVNDQKMRNLFEQNRVKNGFKQLCKARIGLLVYKYGLSDVVLVDLHLLTIFRIPTLRIHPGKSEIGPTYLQNFEQKSLKISTFDWYWL